MASTATTGLTRAERTAAYLAREQQPVPSWEQRAAAVNLGPEATKIQILNAEGKALIAWRAERAGLPRTATMMQVRDAEEATYLRDRIAALSDRAGISTWQDVYAAEGVRPRGPAVFAPWDDLPSPWQAAQELAKRSQRG